MKTKLLLLLHYNFINSALENIKLFISCYDTSKHYLHTQIITKVFLLIVIFRLECEIVIIYIIIY